MLLWNRSGALGVAIGSLAGYGVGHYLHAIGRPPFEWFCWGGLVACVVASMFGLFYDRTVVPEFHRSYKVLSRHFVRAEVGGPDWDPRERVAFFGFPIAWATIFLAVLCPFLVVLAWNGVLDRTWTMTYTVAAGLALLATLAVGRATADYRLLERELRPDAPAVAVSRIIGVDGPPTPTQLERLRRKGRKQAVLVIIVGLAALIGHHYMAMQTHEYYPKIVFGIPMCIVASVFALFEPRIMTRHLPVGKHYPRFVLLLTLLAAAIGATIGWQLDSWYRG
jgi:hypothetical protein